MPNGLACSSVRLASRVDDPAKGLSAARWRAASRALWPCPRSRPCGRTYAGVPSLRRRVRSTAGAATAGVADATSFDRRGPSPPVVVDWKSDVDPDAQTIDHYRAQVRAYLDMTGAERGLIVLMTTGG